MTPFFVADVGNTRIKCRVNAGENRGGNCTLLPAKINAEQIVEWACEVARSERQEVLSWPWTVAAVNGGHRDRFVGCLVEAGFRTQILSDYREIPIKVDLKEPERVGIDRLLAAFAASRDAGPRQAIAVISAGTAVTVDLVDSAGAFRGGVILPGFHLMARSLREHTAALPFIESFDPLAPLPARTTEGAIAGGICAAVAGGIDRAVEQYRWLEPNLRAYLTGGDEKLLTTLKCKPILYPYLPLQGLSILVRDRP